MACIQPIHKPRRLVPAHTGGRHVGTRAAEILAKRPDFIDAAWLGAAADSPCRNLDSFMMPPEVIGDSLREGGRDADMAVVEGNRGLFDGMDAQGSHSTAQLAKLIGAPVVMVIDVSK